MPLRLRFPIRLTDPLAADSDRVLVRRFVDTHDESAFAGLVSRHARMIFGVCRRTVGDEQLAEDAFQAVFLVLARNPKRAVSASSVGGWLFGIARRVGLAIRRHEMRQQRHLAVIAAKKDEPKKPDFDDLLQVLDEELDTLPTAYRAPLIACFLEERTQDEAARQLGWSCSTLRRRLERGKELLRARLVRRGVTLAAGLFAGGLAPSARAAVSPRLLAAASGSAPPSHLARVLASEVFRRTLTIKAGFAAMLIAAALGGLAVALYQSLPSDKPPEVNAFPGPAMIAHQDLAPAPRSNEKTPWVTITGRVVFPEERDVPKPKKVSVNTIKDRSFFTATGEEVLNTDILVDSTTRGIANVVVWLRPDNDDRTAAFPVEKIHPVLARAKPADHRVEASREGFSPRATLARVGDRLIFANPTTIPFNVNYFHDNLKAGDKTACFNVLLPSGGTHIGEQLPPQQKMPDYFSDTIHPWVRGYVRVFEHPYFAITDESGNFQIKDTPAGSWRLVVWHERIGYKGGAAGRLGERISIGAGTDASQKLEPLVFAGQGWDGE